MYLLVAGHTGRAVGRHESTASIGMALACMHPLTRVNIANERSLNEWDPGPVSHTTDHNLKDLTYR